MKKPENYPYYTIWSGSLNLGDTPGVFYNSTFIGLILQIPIHIKNIPNGNELIHLMLITSEVETIGPRPHLVYFDWIAGNPLSNPIGQIDDKVFVPGRPEYHLLKVSTKDLCEGSHTITIIVNNEVPLGLKDDFVLNRIDADENVLIRIGYIIP